MIFGSLFALTGCSTINTNNVELNKEPVMKVGEVTLTLGDIKNSFYTYYQNNSNYFANYDEETIEESFYSWTIIREIIEQKAVEGLYHPTKNPNGVIIYTQKDADDVREDAFDYVYNQISAYEKAIYNLEDIDENDYPIWLRNEEDEADKTGFKSYESLKPEVEEKLESEHVDKLSDADIKKLVPDLKARLFKYVSFTDDEGNKTWTDMSENNSETIIKNARNEAYAQYMAYLASNAKSNGKNMPVEQLLVEEFVRVYNAYYDTKLTEMYQKYWLEEYMVDTVNGDKISLGDKAVVRAYLENYFSDMENYQVEDNYISVMTSDDGAKLVLFNYDGKYYYFTVQHILVKYDDYMTAEIAKLPGYSSSASYDAVINDEYVKLRNEKTDDYLMMTTVNEDAVEQFKDSIKVVANYYYYDKEKAGDAGENFGYVRLEKVEKTETTEEYFQYDDGKGKKFEGDKEDVKLMATEEQILSCYTNTLADWNDRARTYINDPSKREEYETKYESMAYVLKAALNVYENSKSVDEAVKLAEVNNKIASLLFVELQWIYSTDSLGNELSNKLGYVVSSMEDENGSWVADFAVGARKILKSIQDGDTSVLNQTNVVTSNYGYHIIKIENIYEGGESLVDMTNFTKQMNINDPEFVEELKNRLQSTYVSTSSNQTVYDYYYDTLYSTLAGTSSSSGTYFVALQYKWLAEYLNGGKIEYIDKLTYQELMDTIA